MVVVPLDSLDQRGHFGGNLVVIGVVLREIWYKMRKTKKKEKKKKKSTFVCDSGSGWVAVVWLDRGAQRGHFGV